MKSKKILVLAAGVLLLIALGAVGYGYAQLRASLMARTGTLKVAGPSAPIEIFFDAKGIPQVWAETERDAYFALGWLHGGERLFQMELLRRRAQGRLAELFGEGALELDKGQRALGFERTASVQQSALGAAERSLIQSYVDGINRSVASRTLPFEFLVSRLAFAPWTELDVLTVSVFQSWYIDDLLSRDDLLLDAELKGIKDERLHTLLSSAEVPENLADAFSPAKASNAWAVSSTRSASGASLLASDPHLDISGLPTFWYIVGLHAADTGLDAVGVTSPGSPALIMGHNRQIAWGMTAAGVDLRDIYIERVDPEDPRRYLTPDGSSPFEVTQETIAVKGGESVQLEVLATRHGPVVPVEGFADRVAVRWAGFHASLAQAWKSYFALPRARDWPGFREAASQVGALNVNWIYADAAGQVGYQLGAPIPVRSFAETQLFQKGWTTSGDWLGYVPAEEKPSVLAPERGWVANCNSAPEGLQDATPLPGTFHTDRILRIEELLSADNPFDVATMKEAQLDVTDRYALRWRDAAVAVLRGLGEQEEAAELAGWDGDMAKTSHEAALLNVWRDRLERAVFYDELQRPVGDAALDKVYQDPASPWYDDVSTPEVETRELLLERTMRAAVAETAGKTWGDLNTLTFRHPFAGTPVVTGLLGLARGPFPRGGSRGSLNTSFYFRPRPDADRFVTAVAPSWRRIVDFADVDSALMVLPTGQSGHPLSPHFFDFFALWQAGEYWQVPLSRSLVEERAQSKLVLTF